MNFPIETNSFERELFMSSFSNESTMALREWLLIAPFSETLFQTLIDVKDKLSEIF